MLAGDSTSVRKTVTFPKQGQQGHAVLGGMIHLRADYQSGYVFKLVNPLAMSFALGKISISSNEIMTQSALDGEVVFCTISKTYLDPFTGPQAISCLQSTENGTFNKIKVAPGAMWFSKDLSPPINYIGAEKAVAIGGKPMKRELIFDGGQNGTLLFTEKIFENSIDTASKSKPLMVKVESVPSKVTLDGVEINVTAFTNNSLTYSLEKPWD
jgi:hypothetical protein